MELTSMAGTLRNGTTMEDDPEIIVGDCPKFPDGTACASDRVRVFYFTIAKHELSW